MATTTDPLARYNTKRDFTRTAEPAGTLVKTSSPYVDGQRVTLLEVDLDEILKDETVVSRLQELGFRVGNDTPANLAAEIVSLEPSMKELIDLTREQ